MKKFELSFRRKDARPDDWFGASIYANSYDHAELIVRDLPREITSLCYDIYVEDDDVQIIDLDAGQMIDMGYDLSEMALVEDIQYLFWLYQYNILSADEKEELIERLLEREDYEILGELQKGNVELVNFG